MKKSIEVNGLRLYARHGVLPQEQKVGNLFEVSVRVDYPFSLDSDNLNDTLSYVEIINLVNAEMEIPSKLLEHVAGRIYHALIGRWQEIAGGKISIRKLTPPISAEVSSVGVTLEW
jgi:dihydroneopterin aldolase